jgi:hypothetical protein
MAFLGILKIGDNLTFYAQTSTPATGAETDADAVPSYRIYEEETALPILTGNMALLDDANTVGFYSEQIAVTVANGFEAGKSYAIRKRALMAAVPGAEVDTFQVTAQDMDDLAVPGDAMDLVAGAVDAAALDPTAGAEIADHVWDEALAGHLGAGSTGEALSNAASCGMGAGAIDFIYTVTDTVTLLPIDGVQVWVSTDLAGLNVIASGYTNAFGQVTFWLDPATYYFWRTRAGYTFANPDTETVV